MQYAFKGRDMMVFFSRWDMLRDWLIGNYKSGKYHQKKINKISITNTVSPCWKKQEITKSLCSIYLKIGPHSLAMPVQMS